MGPISNAARIKLHYRLVRTMGYNQLLTFVRLLFVVRKSHTVLHKSRVVSHIYDN